MILQVKRYLVRNVEDFDFLMVMGMIAIILIIIYGIDYIYKLIKRNNNT
jgi:hypothetical protein